MDLSVETTAARSSCWFIVGSTVRSSKVFRTLESLQDFSKKQRAIMAVGDAVVGSKTRRHRWHDAKGAVCHPRHLTNSAETDQGDLRRVDHAVDGVHALVAQIGDGQGRVRHLGAAQRSGAGPPDQVSEFAHELI